MKKLVIFNLQTDPSSPILGFTLDWIKGFQSHFLVTDVVSTHVGERLNLGKVRILKLGGGNTLSRIMAFLKLFKFALGLIPKRNEYYVFHHMSPRTAVFPGILFKLFGIPQALWYSHHAKPVSLRVAVHIVDQIFSSEKNSFPIVSNRAHFVGHGIPLSKFMKVNPIDERSNEILFLGRISPVKKLDNLLKEVSLLQRKLPVVIVGSSTNKDYVEKLRNESSSMEITLTIYGPVNYEQVQSVMKKYKYFYSGMQNSVDKSALEAAISGCFVLCTDEGTQGLSGMTRVWDALQTKIPETIHKQIEVLESVEDNQVPILRELLQIESRQRNDLDKTIFEISMIMKSEK